MSSQPDDPRARAEGYKQEENDETRKSSGSRKTPRSLDQWATAAGEAIEEAMRQGAFDNLSGRGKPLNLGKDPYTPSDSALAFDILKNNDLAPGWLQQRTDLLREIDKWRTNLRDLVAQFNQAHARTTPATRDAFMIRWQTQRRTLQTQIEEFNRRIGTVNLQLPSVSMEVFKLRIDEELRRAEIAFEGT